jgi:phosphoribosylaminoimidazolecarboxamide formyltransferase/IMP cyclohydrolase
LTKVAIRRALISVYDKTGLTGLAGAVHAAGAEIVSTGSTAAAIAAAGIPVTLVEQLVSNLYPFEQAVASGASPEECVEQIDIGGPAMTRAAAKNHAQVAVITDPSMYAEAEDALAAGGFTLEQRRRLAAQAFARTAAYDVAVASWFASAYPDPVAAETGWPDVVAATWTRREVLRYGENPHQRAALYTSGDRARAASGLAGAEQLHGKAMSYNNYVDGDAARRAAYSFKKPCVAIMKHSNPCGIAVGEDLAEAHQAALRCDPESAFGGVIGLNGVVTAAVARQISEVFTEVVIAPGFEPGALSILTAKKNQRLLRCPPPAEGSGGIELRPVSGGMLLQSADQAGGPGDDPAGWQLAAGPAVSEATLADLAFAWNACRCVKSNAILLASGGASVGIGMGQVNRVDSARLAVRRAGDRARGSVAASDAYFPFADGLQVLADAGVTAVAEPGGSVRDQEVIDAAEAAGISLYFTGVRHFWH